MTRPPGSIERSTFGRLPDGRDVDQFTLHDGTVTLRAIALGGIIAGIRAPDRDGGLDDIVLGHDSVDGYLRHNQYFGALIGRYANRIAAGRFALGSEVHQLTTNDGANHLHGGLIGFDKALWAVEPFESGTGVGLAFTHVSPDGDQGYPGRLDARVTYTLAEAALTVDYHATTDRATVVNMTQHSYFNLGGSRSENILHHELMINADHFTPVDRELIPLGTVEQVAGGPFDFRAMRRIVSRIQEPNQQLEFAGGYDHNFVLSRARGAEALGLAGRLVEPRCGRVLEVWTTEPGVQFYSGNFLNGTIRGRGGRRYGHRAALCLETQHFPDSPNHPDFPSTELHPNETYRSRTVFRFGIEG
jgi:aldose 1-epimerase